MLVGSAPKLGGSCWGSLKKAAPLPPQWILGRNGYCVTKNSGIYQTLAKGYPMLSTTGTSDFTLAQSPHKIAGPSLSESLRLYSSSSSSFSFTDEVGKVVMGPVGAGGEKNGKNSSLTVKAESEWEALVMEQANKKEALLLEMVQEREKRIRDYHREMVKLASSHAEEKEEQLKENAEEIRELMEEHVEKIKELLKEHSEEKEELLKENASELRELLEAHVKEKGAIVKELMGKHFEEKNELVKEHARGLKELNERDAKERESLMKQHAQEMSGLIASQASGQKRELIGEEDSKKGGYEELDEEDSDGSDGEEDDDESDWDSDWDSDEESDESDEDSSEDRDNNEETDEEENDHDPSSNSTPAPASTGKEGLEETKQKGLTHEEKPVQDNVKSGGIIKLEGMLPPWLRKSIDNFMDEREKLMLAHAKEMEEVFSEDSPWIQEFRTIRSNLLAKEQIKEMDELFSRHGVEKDEFPSYEGANRDPHSWRTTSIDEFVE